MLHSGILPHHPRWAKLFENLRYVVIDELHAYRGVFGSHLANVLRRLRRVCRTTARTRRSSARRPPSPTRASWPRRWWRRRSSWCRRPARRAARRCSSSSTRRWSTSELGIRRSYLAETRRIAGEFLKRQPAADRLRAEPPRHRDPDHVPQGRLQGPARRRRGDSRLSRRLSAAAAARDRARAARRQRARGGVDQRARAGHGHRRAGRVGDGRLSGHDGGHLAARRPRRPPQRPVGGGAGGQQRAARPVRRAQPVLLLRRLARARADQPRQPAHPGGPREVRGVRAAVQRHRPVRPARRPGSAGHPAGERVRPPDRRRATADGPVAVDQRVVSRRRGQPAVDLVGQLRGGGHHARRRRDRRDQLHQRPVHAAREGDLPAGRGAVSGGEARLRGAQGLRAAASTATTTPTRSATPR